MTTRLMVGLSAALEAATGVALIADPDLVAGVLLGVGITGGGIGVGRKGGFALISPGTGMLLTYNLLAALYIGHLRIGNRFVSDSLWPRSRFC